MSKYDEEFDEELEDMEDDIEDSEDFDDEDTDFDDDSEDSEDGGKLRVADYKENNIEWLNGQKTMTISLSERRLINKLKKLREQYPDEVELVAANSDGTHCFRIPRKYLKLSRRKDLSEERRQAMSEQGKRMAEKYFNKKSKGDDTDAE